MGKNTTWWDKEVKCPFFEHTDNHKIVCEGVITRTQMQTYFLNNEDKANYLGAVCCSMKGYNNCPYVKCLEANYKDEE